MPMTPTQSSPFASLIVMPSKKGAQPTARRTPPGAASSPGQKIMGTFALTYLSLNVRLKLRRIKPDQQAPDIICVGMTYVQAMTKGKRPASLRCILSANAGSHTVSNKN